MALVPFLIVVALTAGAYAGGLWSGTRMFLGVALPYAAALTFLAGLTYRIMQWAASPVPFHIPTTCGQQKSLPWIKSSFIESPHNKLGVLARMALEVLLFRSLFRNNEAQLREGPRLVYPENKFLWLGALAFHWSMLVVLVRHLRFFLEPVPWLILKLEAVDSFFQVSAPGVLASDIVLAGALLYLLRRRFANPRVRYVSLYSDYFALFLLLGIAATGAMMRYSSRVDTEAVKQLAMGLIAFKPVVPSTVAPIVFVHLALVSALLVYFPFSKLVHMGGIFLSPTRNLANDSRMRRHVNPWDYPVKTHTYAEWEAEFHDKIKAAGLPLERE